MADPKDFSQKMMLAQHTVLIGLLIEHAKAHDQDFSIKAAGASALRSLLA
jgi:hypothetical protein